MLAFEQIAKTVSHYVTGMAPGDSGAPRAAFHPRAASVGHFDGALEWQSLDKFAEACAVEAVPANAPVPHHEIESISHCRRHGAGARVVNVWAGLDFRDSLTLRHVEGR